jgi:hypothetical protein
MSPYEIEVEKKYQDRQNKYYFCRFIADENNVFVIMKSFIWKISESHLAFFVFKNIFTPIYYFSNDMNKWV